MIQPGDFIRFVSNHNIRGIVIELNQPHNDWRFEARLPNSGVCVLWDTGEIYWCCYREIEKICANNSTI